MIPAEAVWWVALVVVGYVALFALVPSGQGQGWAVAAFTVAVLASGAWLVAELGKAK